MRHRLVKPHIILLGGRGGNKKAHSMPFRARDEKLGGLRASIMQGFTGWLQQGTVPEKEAGCLVPVSCYAEKTPMKQYAIMTFFFRHEIKIKLRHNLQALLQAPLLSAAFVSMLARFKLARTATDGQLETPDGMTRRQVTSKRLQTNEHAPQRRRHMTTKLGLIGSFGRVPATASAGSSSNASSISVCAGAACLDV